jgi:hypothetical protein
MQAGFDRNQTGLGAARLRQRDAKANADAGRLDGVGFISKQSHYLAVTTQCAGQRGCISTCDFSHQPETATESLQLARYARSASRIAQRKNR